jgi:hypothetical protein
VAESNHLTVGEIAVLYGLPQGKIRRAVDSLDVEIPRAGLYRLVPRTALGKLALELQRRGWLTSEAAAT